MKPALFLALIVVAGCASQRGFPPQHGLANFDRVDGRIFRGGRPSQTGLEFLHLQGVKTVLNLSQPGETWPGEEKACAKLGMRYIALPLPGMSAPSPQDIATAMTILGSGRGKIYVHCVHGCDRTGTVVACHRISSGWSNNEALREAKIYGLSFWEQGMRAFILHYQPSVIAKPLTRR